MMGSGTILIEAALMARGVAPGLINLGLFGKAPRAPPPPVTRWRDFDRELWEIALDEAEVNRLRLL